MGTILIVDDDREIRTIIAACLQDSYVIRQASNGLQALDLLQGTDQIEVILLDLAMPIMDGRAFMQQLEERGSRAQYRIVLMSAHPELPQEAARLQAEAYLAKPFDLDDLLNMVVAQRDRHKRIA